MSVPASSTRHRRTGSVMGGLTAFLKSDLNNRQRYGRRTGSATRAVGLRVPLPDCDHSSNAGLVPRDMPVAVHGVSGYSGGGRSMIDDYESAGASISRYSPYGLTLDHKHMPELQRYSGLTARPLFTPAVGAFAQGMMVMTTLQLAWLTHAPTVAQLHEALTEHHAAVPGSVVEVAAMAESQVLSQPPSQALNPETHNGTNRMTLHVFGNDDHKQATVVAVYDNLGKGASGAAVQNLDLMLARDRGEPRADKSLTRIANPGRELRRIGNRLPGVHGPVVAAWRRHRVPQPRRPVCRVPPSGPGGISPARRCRCLRRRRRSGRCR